MKNTKLIGICVLTSSLALSGCVARTYNLTRDRIDQDLSSTSGNRGYLMGQAPAAEEHKTTRTTRVVEVELGFTNKTQAKCPGTTPLAATNLEEQPVVQETTPPAEELTGNFEKYTVEKNDTLQKISKKFYGTTKKWPKIFQANKNTLRTPDKLYSGQVLNIPVLADSKARIQETKEIKENLK